MSGLDSRSWFVWRIASSVDALIALKKTVSLKGDSQKTAENISQIDEMPFAQSIIINPLHCGALYSNKYRVANQCEISDQ